MWVMDAKVRLGRVLEFIAKDCGSFFEIAVPQKQSATLRNIFV
jgi:hypothetical protein